MKNFDNFLNESKVAYCGLSIINNSELLRLIDHLDNDWERLAYHMTIKMGNLPDDLKHSKGDIYTLTVSHIGYLDDKVVAVKVDTEIKAENAVPHITLAVNRINGGKPFLSNKISEWEKLEKPIILKGKLSEFTFDGREILDTR